MNKIYLRTDIKKLPSEKEYDQILSIIMMKISI